MAKFNSLKLQFAEKQSYMNPDLPVDVRVKFGFLLNLKRLLVSWGISKTCVDVDDDFVLSVGGNTKPILRAKVSDIKFDVEWMNDEWAQWKDLTVSAYYLSALKAAIEKIEAAGRRMEKGRGKGPVVA